MISRPRSHKRRWLNAWVPDAKWSVGLGGPEHRRARRHLRRVSHQSLGLTRWLTCRNRLNAHAGLIEWFIIAAFHLNYWKRLQLDDKTEIPAWAFGRLSSSVREILETEFRAGSKLQERWHKRGLLQRVGGFLGATLGHRRLAARRPFLCITTFLPKTLASLTSPLKIGFSPCSGRRWMDGLIPCC